MKDRPGIERAALQIALDNGGIFRDRPTWVWREEFREWLSKRTEPNLDEIDAWLSSLTDDLLDTFATGCEEDSRFEELQKASPKGANELLDDYFNEVC